MPVDIMQVLAARQQRQNELRRNPRQFLRTANPVTEALWMALLRPGHQLLLEAQRGFQPVDEGPPSDDPTERQHVIPPKSALEIMAEAAVARAMQGDKAAFAMIAERIEGKVGMRRGDDDPEAAQREEQSLQIVHRLVEQLTAQRQSEGDTADDAAAGAVARDDRISAPSGEEPVSTPQAADISALYAAVTAETRQNDPRRAFEVVEGGLGHPSTTRVTDVEEER